MIILKYEAAQLFFDLLKIFEVVRPKKFPLQYPKECLDLPKFCKGAN